MIKLHRKYSTLLVILLLIEVLIALFVQDNFIRPYIGDFLVVILIYCFIRAFFKGRILIISLGVLLFAYLVETLQYFDFIRYIGLQNSKFTNVILGNSFSWVDIVAYTAGIAFVISIEWISSRKKISPKKEFISS